MKCDMCGKNEAIFHSKTNINGKVTESHLCEDCLNKSEFKDKYKNDFLSFSNNSLFGNSFFEDDFFNDGFFNNNSLLGNFFALPENEFKNEVEKLRCPNCGCSFEDFSNRGLLGCENCYNFFKDELKPIIQNVQHTTKHIGKKPNEKVDKKQDEINNLRKQLKDAVAVENYELASELKKKIVALEGGND